MISPIQKNPSSMRYSEDVELHRLWMLRLLLVCGLLEDLMAYRAFRMRPLLQFLGVDFPEEDSSNPALTAGKVREWLEPILREHEARAAGYVPGSLMAQNVRALSDLIGLNATEHGMLHFTLVAHSERLFIDALPARELSVPNLELLFADVLAVEPTAVRHALSTGAALHQSALLRLDMTGAYSFNSRVDVIGDLQSQVEMSHAHPLEMFHDRIRPPATTERTLADYPHLDNQIDALRALLARSLTEKTTGVNILLYGVPGTGKSELVVTLAKVLGADLFEVAAQPLRGAPYNAENRFRAWRLAQPLLACSPRTLLLFDEIEDVFSPQGEARGFAGQHKAFMNRALETNRIPTFWVSNDVEWMDPAFVRRFDYTLQIGMPPRAVRQRIVDQHFADVCVGDSLRHRFAAHAQLAPGVVARVARLGRLIGEHLADGQLEPALTGAVEQTLMAMRIADPLPAANDCAVAWRPDALNTDCDLEILLQRIDKNPQGRLCFYGVPGAGKTALAHQLAERVGTTLTTKRASDLVSPFVGKTEQNIAQAFRDAQRNHSVLLIDEADSFLRDRNGAQRSYEVSEVNEMLTQMESFDGLFIASTNLFGSLDAACLRRFDLKVHFGYLKPEQGWLLFADACALLGFDCDDLLRPAVARLAALAPGDFATVMRRNRLQPLPDARALLRALEAECNLKPDRPKRAIGFA